MRITNRTRRAAPAPDAEYYQRIIEAVVRDGGWRALRPLPIDGLVLVDSRSVEFAAHEVRLRGRRVVHCSGPCQGHVTCWHRVAVGLAAWSEQHPGWDLNAVCDPEGRPQAALIRALIREYLEPERTRSTKWTLRLDHADQSEVCSDERFALPVGGGI